MQRKAKNKNKKYKKEYLFLLTSMNKRILKMAKNGNLNLN